MQNFFDMTQKKDFVTHNTICVPVTPAQLELLQLVTHNEAEDYYDSLKQVHYHATYCVDKDMLDLWKNGYVHTLLDVIHKIKQEKYSKSEMD